MQDYRAAPFMPEEGASTERSVVSDRDGPQFLPPEEPPPEQPLLPGLPGTPDPSEVRRSGSGRPDRIALLLVITGAAVVIVLVAVLMLSRSGGDGPTIVAGTPTAAPEYAALPDPCAVDGPALPADVRSVRPRRFENVCSWELLQPDRSRSLNVDLRLEPTKPGQGTSGTVAAGGDFADDLAYTADRGRNGGFEGDPERLTGLGDEAFAVQTATLLVAGDTKQDVRRYDLGGAQVEVRSRNVVVTVRWRGADYPLGTRAHTTLVGTRLTYENARRQAVLVAGAMLAKLH